MLGKESRSQCATGEIAKIYLAGFVRRGKNTLKKTKGVLCAPVSWKSVAVAFRSLENVNIHQSPLKKEGESNKHHHPILQYSRVFLSW